MEFGPYANSTILGELKRYFRDTAWALHVDRGAQERARKITEAQQKLSSRTGRMPTVDELAQYLELSQEEVLDGLQTAEAIRKLPFLEKLLLFSAGALAA